MLPIRWLTHTGSSYAALRAKTNQPFPDAPASVFSPKGDSSLPVCISHRWVRIVYCLAVVKSGSIEMLTDSSPMMSRLTPTKTQ